MDKLNQLRLLAGLPIDPISLAASGTKSPYSKRLSEAYKVPQTKTELVPKTAQTMKLRAEKAAEAQKHMEAAVQALGEIPAVDYGGDFAHYSHELMQLLSTDNGGAGFSNLVRSVQSDYRRFVRSENSRVRMEQEEKAIVSSVDPALSRLEKDEERESCAKYEKGQMVTRFGLPYAVVLPNLVGDYVGIAPADKTDDVNEIELVPADELELSAEQGSEDVTDPADDESDSIEDAAEDAIEAEGSDDDYDGGYDDGGDFGDYENEEKKVTEKVHYYYDTEENNDEDAHLPSNVAVGSTDHSDMIWQTKDNDKNEVPTQLQNLGAASGVENERKVRVPAKLKTALKDGISKIEDDFERLSATDLDTRFFYKSLAKAFETLLDYLESGTVYDIKMAQVFLSSLMGPILHKVPATVTNFILKGGETPSLRDFMKPVDKKFPIVGPRNALTS